MMTQDQIKLLDDYLLFKWIWDQDIRVELLDHMIEAIAFSETQFVHLNKTQLDQLFKNLEIRKTYDTLSAVKFKKNPLVYPFHLLDGFISGYYG